jgi:peptidyl-prolyl cis-trans isomerase D
MTVRSIVRSGRARRAAALLGLATTLAACDGLKEAMTAHVDVAATAAGRELSVERLATLMTDAGAPTGKDVARAIADLWVDYQLLAEAAAANDSLNDPATMDAALASVMDRMLVDAWYRTVQPQLQGRVDSAAFPSRYANGELFAARHILVQMPQNADQAKRDSVKRKAEAIRARVTSTNFATVAQRESQDPGSAARGGDLGVFFPGQMVGPFEEAVRSTAPGEISAPIETQFGWHIIRRSTYDEVREEASRALGARGLQVAESTFVDSLERAAKVELKANAVATLRGVTEDLPGAVGKRDVLASLEGGAYTAGDAATMLLGVPQRQQLVQQVATAPDSVVREQLLKPLVRSEVVRRAAKRAGTALDTGEVAQLRRSFVAAVDASWKGLDIAPNALADSAQTKEARQALAASRVESALARMVGGQLPVVPVPPPVQQALKARYGGRVNVAALDRAVERARQLKAQRDSAANAALPPSEVPIPGVPPAGGAAPTGGASPDSGR